MEHPTKRLGTGFISPTSVPRAPNMLDEALFPEKLDRKTGRPESSDPKPCPDPDSDLPLFRPSCGYCSAFNLFGALGSRDRGPRHECRGKRAAPQARPWAGSIRPTGCESEDERASSRGDLRSSPPKAGFHQSLAPAFMPGLP